MKKSNKDEKTIFIDVVKEGRRISVLVRPEMTAEGILTANGLYGGRLGTMKKGPFFQDLERPYLKIRSRRTFYCLFHVQ